MMIVLEKVSATATYRGDGIEAERKADEEPEHRSERHLPETGQNRDHPERADQLHVQLHAYQEKQDRDAEFGQKLDLLA